ncbi:acyl-CoA dehydrogenase [Amycolatopsis sp.]|uniref:acyl-CoA dehydrogenase n=1 Tax=Amycolatopsis sp. TaxID=37632 RepID=UPI002D135025|nr:acyl-CoA dehydrogenase [Amycolatopsis sp.]HVV12686.1 acyl-CoA dehydrogenase [Amycolatopsis sp.]
MDLLPSADQVEMTDAIEQFLRRRLSVPQLRGRMGEPAPPHAWTEAAELGVFSLGLPEEAGGAGCPAVEEALVFRALGRHLAPPGFLGAVLGARLAHSRGDKELRDELAAGARRVAVATPAGVVDLPGADLVLGPGPELVALAELSPGRRLDCLDPTVTLTEVTGWPPAGEPPAEGLHLLAALLVAAMLSGIADAARDAGVAYAEERVQFGRPIGVNQAIKHPCADMAMRSEAAGSLLLFAAMAVREGRDDAAFQVAAAKRIATHAAYENARANVQIHGGMGFTWEHDAHLLVTRTRLLDQFFGDVRTQQAAILATAPSIP